MGTYRLYTGADGQGRTTRVLGSAPCVTAIVPLAKP
jgi:hypothetical protein